MLFAMENAEEILNFLEEFSKRKPKTIPQELNDYLAYVARTGDPVYQWSLVKNLFKEKLLNVLSEFYETSPGIDIPPYPNVDPFNYDIMRNSLLERLDSFSSAPFTVQRICELLTFPRKQYNRIDKFMRAIEKNILVVSTREPGILRHIEQENGESVEPIVNGSDNNSEYNIDVEMEDMSWKENNDPIQTTEPQPSSSDIYITVDKIEAHLHVKQKSSVNNENKIKTQYESVTPPELNMSVDEPISTIIKNKPLGDMAPELLMEKQNKSEDHKISTSLEEHDNKVENNQKFTINETLVIPDIKIDDVEMTEQKLRDQLVNTSDNMGQAITGSEKECRIETKANIETQSGTDESNFDSNTKEESEIKLISEISTSSEESSSSSDNTDGNSNSPSNDNETVIDVQEESNQSEINTENTGKESNFQKCDITLETKDSSKDEISSENYTISDVSSELRKSPMKEHLEEQVKKEELCTNIETVKNEEINS